MSEDSSVRPDGQPPLLVQPAVHAGDVSGVDLAPRRLAFENIYRSHREDIYRYCLARLSQPATAEDVCEDVFVSAYKAYMRRPVPDDELRPWLARIARNAAIDHWRRHHRWDRVTSLLHGGERSPLNVEQSVIMRDDLRQLLAAIGRLRRRERELLSLRVGAGLTYAEMGAIVGLSEEGVRRATQRALDAVRAATRSGDD